MSASDLLDRLEGVRQVGRHRWRARCPAHGGKNTNTLSIGEGEDGTVLVHCFSGCAVADVVAAVGLGLTDLFPDAEWKTTGKHTSRPRRPRVDWVALIAACERDLLLLKIVLVMIVDGEQIEPADLNACDAAASRVLQAITEARHA